MNNVHFDFSGKTAIVTGAASGMGAAVAELLRSAGANVIVADLNDEAAQRVATAIGAMAFAGDVSNPAYCDQAVARAVHAYGGLEIVVNAAGTIARKHVLDTTNADWERVMAVNAGGVFYMCRAAARWMRDHGGGAIVNFGSIWGELGGKGHVAYAASKGAVHQITRTFALDLARDGIRVNAVCPGEVDTPMLRTAGRAHPLTDAQAMEIGERVVPMGRLANPVEIARVVAFLCSDAASYVTGATYYVDAAYSAQ